MAAGDNDDGALIQKGATTNFRPFSSFMTSHSKGLGPASTTNANGGCLHQRQQINDSTQPLAQRIASSNQNPYNTLLLDRHCASCMTGFAPQVLHCIKLACLSYVNSPIKYSLNYGAGSKKFAAADAKDLKKVDKKNEVELSFTEITYLKEFLLIQC